MIKFLALAGALALAAPASFAATVTFTDRASFTATLGSSVTDDYENSGYVFSQTDAVMSAVLGETGYETTGFTDNNLVATLNGSHRYCGGCNGSFLLSFKTTSVGDADGVFGVGFDFFNQSAPLYTAFVTYGDGSTENFALPQVIFPDALEFFGITSDLKISSIAFGLTDGGTTTGGHFGIDDLTIGASGSGTAVVPLPASALLLLGGLGALAATRRRRRA